jgi:hypothetical protein
VAFLDECAQAFGQEAVNRSYGNYLRQGRQVGEI